MIIRKLAVSLALASLVACSSNSSSFREDDSQADSGLSGRVDNSVRGARVTLVELTTAGQPTREVDDSDNVIYSGYFTTTDTVGVYDLTYEESSNSKAVLVIATADSGAVTYQCERPSGCGSVAYLGNISIDDSLDMRAGVGELADNMTINVNWITELASTLATTAYIDASPVGDADPEVDEETDTAKRAFYSEYSIELANKHVSTLFGLTDVVSVTPVGPSAITAATDKPSSVHQESIYMGALLSALPVLADLNGGSSYVSYLTALTDEFISDGGQLLQRAAVADPANENVANVFTLYGIYNQAYQNLNESINYFEERNATVPVTARRALTSLKTRRDALVIGQMTDVEVDVSEELADWKTNIDQAKVFIQDLTARFKDFTGQETGNGFIDADYSDRMEAYFEDHNAAYDGIAPSLNSALKAVVDMTQYLLSCESPGNCDAALNTGGFSYNSTAHRVSTSGGSLTLTLQDIPDEGSKTIQINLNNDGALSISGGSLTWKTATNSVDVETIPNIVLQYDDVITDSTIPAWADQEPSALYVVWPSVSLPLQLSGTSLDAAAKNSVEVLFETTLVGVRDPIPAHSAYEQRFNAFTVVLWVCSLSATGAGCETELSESGRKNVILSELITVNAGEFYPDTKWPEFSNVFQPREISAAETPQNISNLVKYYRGVESDTGYAYLDSQILNEPVRRMRVYPSPTIDDATIVEDCIVDSFGAGAEIESCESSPIIFAEAFDLEQWIQDLYDADALQIQFVTAHGSYVADLTAGSQNLVSGDDVVIPSDTELTGYPGELLNQYRLTIGTLDVRMDSVMPGDDQVFTTVIGNLIRKTKDYFDAEIRFGYNYDYELSGIYAGADAQSFTASYTIEYDEANDFNVELGSLTVFRSGVTLFGAEEPIGFSASSEANYTPGTTDTGCGLYNRDKLVSEGDCNAVAYITFRGALLGSIREERPGVYVVRYVDGTWTILGS